MSLALRAQREEAPKEQPLHIAERIANEIIDCMYRKGTWAVADLRAANFSYDDIARYLPAACKIVEQRPRPSQR